MFALVTLALAAPLVLEDPTRPSGRVGLDVSTSVDIDADGFRDVWAESTGGFTFWSVPERARVLVERSEDVPMMRAVRFASLGTYGWGGSVGLLYWEGLAQAVAPDGVDPSWRTPVIDVLLAARESSSRVADAVTIDGSQYVAVRYVYNAGSRAAGAELALVDTATGGVGCMSGTQSFGEALVLADDFPAASTGRLVVLSTDPGTGTAILAWWELSGLPSYETCASVAATNLGDATSVSLPVVPVQMAVSGARGGAGAWVALLDAEGLVHVVPFSADGMWGEWSTPFGDAYALASPTTVSGTVLLVADVTGDDANELVLADPSAGTVLAFGSTVDGSGRVSFVAPPVMTWAGDVADGFGSAIAALPDRDGDGKAELVVGLPAADGGAGRVEVYFSGPWSEPLDTDGDGVVDTDDCFPEDATRYPGAPVHRDADGDGQGVGSASDRMSCPWTLEGFVTNGLDCDDTDPAVYDGARVWADADGDGQGDADASFLLDCSAPGDAYATDARDCDDTDATTYQGAQEACDGTDNDCNGMVDDGVLQVLFADADGDGFGAGSPVSACPGSSYTAAGGDCDDADPAVSPDGEEVVGDGRDNDCTNGDLEVSWGRGGLGCASTRAGGGTLAVGLALLAGVSRRRSRARGGTP